MHRRRRGNVMPWARLTSVRVPDLFGGSLLALLLLLGCGASVPTAATVSARKPSSPHGEVANRVSSSAHLRYCTATYDEWFVPQCVGELSADQARRRFESFRLIETNGRVVRVDRISSDLRFLEDSPGVTATVLRYDGARVVELIGLDRNDIVRTRQQVVSGGTRWLDSVGRPLPEGDTTASGTEESLDARGRVVERRYVDAEGNPATRSDGVIAVRYRYGFLGLVSDECYFGRDGSPLTDKKGAHCIVHTYGADGLEHETRFLDRAALPAARFDGVQRIVKSFDENGNRREEAMFDTAGNLHEGETRAAIQRDKRDALGQPVEYSFFDRNGAPVTSSFGYVTRRLTVNDKGQAIEFSFLDGTGNPARVPNGHSRQRREYDARDRVVYRAWFNPDGTPFVKDGSAVELYSYNDRDNMILRRSLSDTGAPTRAEGRHYSILRQTFDVDRLIRQDYLDEAGQPFAIDGSAGVVYVYDSLGAHTVLQLDAHGLPLGRNRTIQASRDP